KQLDLVESLKTTQVPEMKKEPLLGAVHWQDVYAGKVAEAWKRDTSEAAARYRDLFRGTHEKMQGIVYAAIEDGVRDVQRALVERFGPTLQKEIEAARLRLETLVLDPFL